MESVDELECEFINFKCSKSLDDDDGENDPDPDPDPDVDPDEECKNLMGVVCTD